MTQAIDRPIIQENILLDKFRNLTIEQQTTILDFVEFMENKKHKFQENQEVSAYDELQEFIGCVDGGQENQEISAYDLAKDLAGSVKSGIGDLSTNKKYFQGFGK